MQHFSGIYLKRISVNTVIQFFLRITNSIPTLAATILVAYFGGYETLGSFTKVIAFVSIFYLVVEFGLNSVFLREYFNSFEKYFGNLILLRLIFSLILIPVVIFFAYLLPQNKIAGTGFSDFEKYGIYIFSLTLITVGLSTSLQAILQKKLSYYLSLFPSLAYSLILLVCVIISSIKGDLHLLLFSYVLSGVVLVVLLLTVIKKTYRITFRKTPDFYEFSKRLFIMSLPLGAMLSFNLLYTKADTFLLALFRPTYDVGVYGISYKFFEVLLTLPTFLANSVYPLLLQNDQNSKRYKSLFQKYMLLFIFVSTTITAVSFLMSPLITLFKSDFSHSVAPLQILTLSLPFFFLTSLLQWHFLIKKRMRFLVPLYGGVLLLNIILNIVLIPHYSYYAAAITTGACEALVFIIMLWYFRRTK